MGEKNYGNRKDERVQTLGVRTTLELHLELYVDLVNGSFSETNFKGFKGKMSGYKNGARGEGGAGRGGAAGNYRGGSSR